MIAKIEGKVFRANVHAKGAVLQIMMVDAKGQQEAITVFAKRAYKIGEDFKGAVNIFGVDKVSEIG